MARAFGGGRRRARRGGRRGMAGYHPCMHDAFHFTHLPLPRPTGPYTVIRTTQLVESDYKLITFGPTFDRDNGRWTNAVGYGVVDIDKKLDASGNMYVWPFDTMAAGSWIGAQVAPAAFSVQAMNPGSIQGTNGIVYAGRVRTAFKYSADPGATGRAVAQQFVSYNNPRLLGSAKLAFRGVQVDGVPFNMSELANFTQIKKENATTFAANTGMYDHTGFGPMFFFNPDGLKIQYLVCCEWRVRFDPSNPAQAAHVQYNHANESIWMKALHAAEALGNGVVDIADRVAETGNAVFGASASAYRAGRGMRAITNGVGQLALGV